MFRPKSVALLAVRSVLVVAGLVFLSLAFGGSARVSAATISIDAGDSWFCNSSFQNGICETSINVGDTVSWNFNVGALPHTSTECAPSCGTPIVDTSPQIWDSGLLSSGTYEFTFNTPGIYDYHCNIHKTSMQGRIIVGSVGGVAELPDVGPSPLSSSGTSGAGVGPVMAIAAIIAGLVGLGGAAWWSRRWLIS